MFNVKERLYQMSASPRMWAGNKEGFIMQVLLLLEFIGIKPYAVHSFLVEEMKRHGFNDEINDNWGHEVVQHALDLIEDYNLG